MANKPETAGFSEPIRTPKTADNPALLFDISLDDVVKKGTLDDYLRVREIEQRKLFLDNLIEVSNAMDIAMSILQYNRDDLDAEKKDPNYVRKPIQLYINSPGGSVLAGVILLDAIEQSKTPVHTINVGYSYSMAFMVFIVGSVRYAMPNATFLLHEGTESYEDSVSKAHDMQRFMARMNNRLKKLVLDHTKITSEEFDQKRSVEWYMFAKDAKKKGIVDFIVGEKGCTIDNIV